MQEYKQIYADAFDLCESSFPASEISGARAVDIHHIIGRGKGGECRIENLMAVTRQEHIDYGDKKDYMVMLLKIHRRHLIGRGIKHDPIWFKVKIDYYEAMTS